MDRKKLVLLIGALVIAVATALAARSMFAGAAAPEAEAAPAVPQGPKVLVAKRAMPVGTIITADAVGYQLWPQEMVQDAYFIDGEADMSKLLGTVVRNSITAGEPVTQGSLVSPGDRGFLAAALSPGMRAITVPVNAKTGVGYFIFPGDRVDIMLTQSVSGADDGAPLKTTETILRNLRILATNTSTETTTTPDGKTQVNKVDNVTLEVTPKIAEKISVAQTIGTLSLSLRSIADNQSELERAIASGEVDLPDGASKEQEEKLLRQAMSRPQDGASTYVTGGDVSRFQRSSVPRSKEQVADQVVTGMVNAIAGAVGPAVPSGPTVRVTRGTVTSVEPIGTGAGALLDRTAQGAGQVGQVAPVGLSTLR
jgi:pilus assembly protein CpaB